MKRKGILACCILLLMLLLSAVPSVQAEENKRVIRVGFPLQPGLTVKNEDGTYGGYTYDYLKEISQYTGWTYEFVEIEGDLNEQLMTYLDMLKKGEIDLLGAMSYNDSLAKLYDYPTENYGNAYSVIAVLNNDERYDEYNLTESKEFRIALNKTAENRNTIFRQYAELNGMSYKIIWCKDGLEQINAVREGKADGLVTVDLSLESDFRSIAKFSPTPFYFATTKGNSELISELNRAIVTISEVNPTLQSTLYTKYFTKASDQLLLNHKEKAYIKEHPTLKVLVQDGFGPLQYYNEKREIRGVANDLLRSICKKAGWKLEYIYTDSYTEFEKKLKSKEADIVLNIQYDYDLMSHSSLLLSTPYLETERVLVAGTDVDVTTMKGKKAAIYKGNVTEKYEDTKNARFYDSIEEALRAVDEGVCDYTYTDSYAASFYQYRDDFTHYIIYPQANSSAMKYSMGVIDSSENMLATILNKGIRTIDTSELEGYIYENAQQQKPFTLMTYIQDNPLQFLTLIVSAAALLLLLGYVYYRNQMRMKKQIELENTRYRYLSEIMKEVIFEYDFTSDTLRLTSEAVEIFQVPEVIEHFSAYKSDILVADRTGNNPLYEQLMKQVDTDADVQLSMQGKSLWYHIYIKVIYDGTQAVSAIGRVQNIHAEKMEKEQLRKKSMLDSLTDILNAASVKKQIQEVLEAESTPHALYIMDLDDFKEVNDVHGHYMGDQVLIQTATALREVFRDSAIVGRLGGDEFVVFMKHISSREQVMERCQLLTENLRYKRESAGLPIPTISIGVSLSRAGDDFVSLYQRADVALYDVKHQGKDNYVIDKE